METQHMAKETKVRRIKDEFKMVELELQNRILEQKHRQKKKLFHKSLENFRELHWATRCMKSYIHTW